jgi:uncharacterized membrane protein
MSTTGLIAGTLEVVAFGGVTATIASTVARYPHLPETVPIHFGVTGKANSWGPRGFVFLIPAIAVVFFIGATFFNPIFGYVMVDKHGAVLHTLVPMPCGVLSVSQLLFYSIQVGMLESARTGSPLNMRFVWLNVAILIGFVIVATFASIASIAR